MLRRIPEVHAVEEEWGLGLERLVAEHTTRGDSVLVFFKNETQMKKYPGEVCAQTMSAVMPLNKTLINSLNMAALRLQIRSRQFTARWADAMFHVQVGPTCSAWQSAQIQRAVRATSRPQQLKAKPRCSPGPMEEESRLRSQRHIFSFCFTGIRFI